jgi:hypothetical protein
MASSPGPAAVEKQDRVLAAGGDVVATGQVGQKSFQLLLGGECCGRCSLESALPCRRITSRIRFNASSVFMM